MNICIFGASSDNIDPIYPASVEELCEKMAKRGHSLVYGGGATGLMAAAARGTKRGGGKVFGFAPSYFRTPGVLCEDCTELQFTDTMRERKQLMEDRSDAVIATPGGNGTFEEFFEILTLRQIGQYRKPIAVFNINGYYNRMLEMIDGGIQEGFIHSVVPSLFLVSSDIDEILDYLESEVNSTK